LMLDVDRLKSLNDAHGHLAGAEAVRTVGHLM
jgi:GGDEF domain-containing protein